MPLNNVMMCARVARSVLDFFFTELNASLCDRMLALLEQTMRIRSVMALR